MIEFQVTNTETTSEQSQAIDSVEPFSIQQIKGRLTPEEETNKSGFCQVNGIILCPGDRLVVEGTTRQSPEWTILLAWDGCDLGIFPGEKDFSGIKIVKAK